MSYFRNIVNAPGVTYDATKLDTFFREDILALQLACPLSDNVVSTITGAPVSAGATGTIHSFTCPAIPVGKYGEIEVIIENTNNASAWQGNLDFSGNTLAGFGNATTGYWHIIAKVFPTIISSNRQTWVRVVDANNANQTDSYAQPAIDFSSPQTCNITVKNNMGAPKTFKVVSMFVRVYESEI